MKSQLQQLQQYLQYTFSNAALLERAVTHRSFGADHNERLEFLGDSVLNLTMTALLYECLSGLPEGDLSRIRANLVKQESLHKRALEMGLPTVLRVGEGEARNGGQKRPSILADALEAVVGAVFLDGGYPAAQAVVRRLFESVEITPLMQAAGKDPKTQLQEWLQARRMQLPGYRVVATIGAAHKQTFDVECEITELSHTERGIGDSRRAAEQAAASAMLAYLGV